MASIDHGQGPHRSNIARPLSRLPLARASAIPTSIHQDETTRSSHSAKCSASNSKKPLLRPLGESNSVSTKPTFGFGWKGSITSGIISPTSMVPVHTESDVLDTTPPSARSELAVLDIDDENGTNSIAGLAELAKPTKRRPRPSLSERTMETLSLISPAPSPNRRRSSTVKGNGSMGPPNRPASAMRNPRPSTPVHDLSARPLSPVKRQFRPPGKPTTSAKEVVNPMSMDKIYTPPKAFVRDHASRIGRPARDDRRSISTTISAIKDEKLALKPTRQAGKVKSMYDLRAASSRSASSRPSIANPLKHPETPPNLTRKSSFQDTPHTGLLKARSPGENVLAAANKQVMPTCQRTVQKKSTRRAPSSKPSMDNDSSPGLAVKSSETLRDMIAKAKAARKEQVRSSGMDGHQQAAGLATNEPVIGIEPQAMRRKVANAIISGTLNLSAMSLKSLPSEVLSMSDSSGDYDISWSEAVDLKKLVLADNEIESLPDNAFPDWSREELEDDVEKSNQFGGLEVLDLHGNSLQSIPIGFRRLQNLSVLNLSGNNLSITIFSIISELVGLRELRLAKNGLHGDLPAHAFSMPHLQILDLGENQLDVLPSSISNLQSLQKLLLGGNRFSSVLLENLPVGHLVELDLSRNMLDSSFDAEPLRRFQKLQSLNLSYNNLERLCSNLDLSSLQTLAVDNNRIDTLPDLSKCAELTILTASNNDLTSLPEGFYGLNRLKTIDVSNNGIRNFGPEIAGMNSLIAVNITGNPLREKKFLTMNVDEIRADILRKTLFSGDLSSAVSKTQDNQSSMDVETALCREKCLLKPKAGVLDLASLGLSDLQPAQVDLSEPIHTIRLANNNLSVFPVELLMHPSVRWSLRSLDLSHNPILHSTDYLLTEIHMPVLRSLYIVSTGLTTLDTLTTYLKAPELRELNISCHRLTGHLPWVRAWYPVLTTLLASDNWFESIDVEAVRGLEVLDVRSNEIEVLPPKIGLLGNRTNKTEDGRLRTFECSGNRFRVPRLMVIEKGTQAVLRDLRRMIPMEDVPDEWANEI